MSERIFDCIESIARDRGGPTYECGVFSNTALLRLGIKFWSLKEKDAGNHEVE